MRWRWLAVQKVIRRTPTDRTDRVAFALSQAQARRLIDSGLDVGLSLVIDFLVMGKAIRFLLVRCDLWWGQHVNFTICHHPLFTF